MITEDCAILTVIESRDGKRPPTYETKEHDSFIDAIEYLGGESSIMSGDWDRVYIVNPGEAVYDGN